jgi:hypothetical protein
VRGSRGRPLVVRDAEIRYACGYGRRGCDEVFNHLLVFVHLIHVVPILIDGNAILSRPAASDRTRVTPVHHGHISHLSETKTGRPGSCCRRVAQLYVIDILPSMVREHVWRNLLREEGLGELSLFVCCDKGCQKNLEG